MTGDWLGVRTGLLDRGVTVDVSTTQYYQGVTTGGLERSFTYGGRNDYFLTLDGEKRDEMRSRAPGARTVPQIFIDDTAIGGSDDLAALERAGKLDGLLGL